MRPFSHARPFLCNRFLSVIQLGLPEGSAASQLTPFMWPLLQLGPVSSPVVCQELIRHHRSPAHHTHLTSANGCPAAPCHHFLILGGSQSSCSWYPASS